MSELGVFEREFSGGKFRHVAQKIASILEGMEQEISPDMLPHIVSDALGEDHNFNLYPGLPGHECYNLAFFVSLQAKRHRKRWPGGGKHLSFSQALSTLIKHMQGVCHSTTTHAVFITDSWDVDAYEAWKHNLKTIKSQYPIEVYLIVSGHAITAPL